jgi:hypothetical protein
MKFTGGLPETKCGAGSTLKTTECLREKLPALLRGCGIKYLVDAPCGDGNWMAQTDLSGVRYHGIDLSEENLLCARRRPRRPGFEPVEHYYEFGDINLVSLPAADAILCRDFFQHLPTQMVICLLQRIRKHGFPWLLATSFDNQQNDEIGPTMFRSLNLQLSPFNLGQPDREILDPPNSGRILGAWRLC